MSRIDLVSKNALLAFIFFYVLNLVTFVILAIFAIFVTQSFLMARKCLVTFASFAISSILF